MQLCKEIFLLIGFDKVILCYAQKYQDWKDGLPNLNWLNEVLPDNEKWQQWRGSLIDFKDNIKNNVEIGK